MLLSAGVPADAERGGWAVEVKFDGIRAPAPGRRGPLVDGALAPGRDCTHQFPELAPAAASLASREVLLDGELVHFGDDGRPDFTALRRRLTAERPEDARRAAAA